MSSEQWPDKIFKPWEQLDTHKALDEPWFTVRKDVVELPSGTVLDDYFVWESPEISTVVPVTPEGKFVLCQQYRYAVGLIMYQFPAGAVNNGETPDEAAIRELKEETNYITESVEHLGDSAAYPTKLSGMHHLFLAKNVKLSDDVNEDEHEPIKVLLKTPEELWELIKTNQFQVADSLAAGLLALKKLGF